MTNTREIQRVVARHFHVPVATLRSRSRQRGVARARQVAMYLARKLTGASYPALGRLFNRHHTSVLTSVRRATQALATDQAFATTVARLEATLVDAHVTPSAVTTLPGATKPQTETAAP